jgi:hypothetical protein
MDECERFVVLKASQRAIKSKGNNAIAFFPSLQYAVVDVCRKEEKESSEQF